VTKYKISPCLSALSTPALAKLKAICLGPLAVPPPLAEAIVSPRQHRLSFSQSLRDSRLLRPGEIPQVFLRNDAETAESYDAKRRKFCGASSSRQSKISAGSTPDSVLAARQESGARTEAKHQADFAVFREHGLREILNVLWVEVWGSRNSCRWRQTHFLLV